MCDCADIVDHDQHSLVDYANRVHMTEMSPIVLIFRLCLIDLLSGIASPPSVSPAP